MDSKYSLNNLRNITIPDPPPLWPPAPGTSVILVLLLLAILYGSFLFYNHWKENAYRRAGLLLLQDSASLHDISITLKRVALAAFSREQVASLYGKEWIAFLNDSCARCSLPQSLEFSSNQAADEKELALAANWIRYHSLYDSSGVQRD